MKLYIYHLFVLIECQTETGWFAVETKISVFDEKLKDRPEFSAESVLEKLTSGMPRYDLFLAYAKYLKSTMATCSLL